MKLKRSDKVSVNNITMQRMESLDTLETLETHDNLALWGIMQGT